jgi:hypothetical protein
MKMLTKTRHNKKRNTAFIYEALVRELTKCIVANDEKRKGIVVSIVREHFQKGSVLRQELDLYKSLYEATDVEREIYEKMIHEVKLSHFMINKEDVFAAQTSLINKINKSLSKDVFANFVPNYKDLATISQILNPDVSVKHRVLLEGNLTDTMCPAADTSKEAMAPIDNLVYKTFVKKFNEQYGGKLLEEQETLLSRYITSFHDGGLELKIFLNEEISRLRRTLNEYRLTESVKGDEILRENVKQVLEVIDTYKEKEVDAETIQQILRIQSLTQELKN